MVVEVNKDISVGDCPADVPTMTDSPHNVPAPILQISSSQRWLKS
jgi:hypothetical protein